SVTRRGTARRYLPHHPRNEPGPAPRRLDFLFQEAMGFPADISSPDIGPGPAFIVAGAGRLAKLVAFAAFHLKTLVVTAGAIDGGFNGPVARLDDAGAAHARDAAIFRHARRHVALQPAHRATGDVGRIAERPGPAAPVALARQRAIGRVARNNRRAEIVAARTIEIGLGPRAPRAEWCRQSSKRQACKQQAHKQYAPRPKKAAFPHADCFQLFGYAAFFVAAI